MSRTESSTDPQHLHRRRLLAARLERIDRWGLSPLFITVIGMGMLFVQYDIFNINVTFSQTCTELLRGCTPETAVTHIGGAILASLIGYGVGALVLGRAADRFGRHSTLIVSMLVTGVGSAWSALTGDFTGFVLSRLVTGIGVGADLAIINTYVNEVAPKQLRAKFTSVLFLLAGVGAVLAIWLGLLFSTPATPWPDGLPFALASESFGSGWRWVYGIGAILAAVSLFLRFRLPESPRWLLSAHRLDQAEAVIGDMELRASRKGPLRDPDPVPDVGEAAEAGAAPGTVTIAAHRSGSVARTILGNPVLRRRMIVLSLAWMFAYVTLYTFGGAFTPALTGLGYSMPVAGMISAIGILGFLVSGVFATLFSERLERRTWMAVGTVIGVIGVFLVAFSGENLALVYIGAVILFFGQNLWVAPQYALTAEAYPTEVRATAYAWTDSIGHVGGGIGVFVIAGLLQGLDPLVTLLVLMAFMAIGSVINLAAPKTRGCSLEEIS
ncbi:MAG: MFS transporter [Leucobacter sp.]